MSNTYSSSPPTLPVRRRIKRIEPVQCGKVLGILYALLGLIFLPFAILFPVIMSQAQSNASAGMVGFGLAISVIVAVMIPVVYGAMGFVMGLLGAVIYNLVAKWIGGIEVEVE